MGKKDKNSGSGENKEKGSPPDKVFWHGAFFEALQLELHEYAGLLTFVSEHRLSKEALIMDTLVIKKEPGAKIEKNIGRIFRGHNVVEFKSEKDSLSVPGYNKVMAYAFLYSSFTPASVLDITVTFVAPRRPRELFRHLGQERGLAVSEVSEGIHSIEGEPFTVQVLESRRLPKEENLFLRSLRGGLSAEDVAEAVGRYRAVKPFEPKNTYWDRLIKANPAVFKEAMLMGDAMKELFFEVAEENGWLKESGRLKKETFLEVAEENGWLEKERFFAVAERQGWLDAAVAEKTKEFARELLLIGRPVEEIMRATKLPYETVAGLAQHSV